MFVCDYVKTKYNDIYVEAATFYNQLNQHHPQKPDLRKTVEFRRWKNYIAVEKNIPTTPIPRQKPRPYIHIKHPDMQIDNATSPLRITARPPYIAPMDLSGMEISIPEEIQNPVPQNPPSVENQQSDKRIDKRIAGMTMQLNIPLMQNPTSKPMQPDQIITTAFEETIMDEGDQPEALNPSILEEIPSETMEKIIHELQSDPNLNEIMEDIEKSFNIEEEIIGLTVDLPDLEDPLEDELMLW